MPKLSICYIVKNEIERLPASINRMRELADEIVVVDTGSTDGTKAYAKDVADIYDEIKWNDDFAEARNRALDLATGDWILMLDADEWIDKKYFPEIYKKIATDSDVDGYILQVYNFIENPFWISKPHMFYGRALRLFRNKKEFVYCGIIHEQLEGVKNKTEINVPIYHFQYYEADKINKKFKMYVRLMEQKIRQEGRTYLNLIHLSDAYRRKYLWTQDGKALKKMLSLLDEALRLNRDPRIVEVYEQYKKQLRESTWQSKRA